MESNPQHEEVIAAQHLTVDQVTEKIDRVHGPYWKARNDFLKLLITINTAVIAGTVTFSSSFIDSSNTTQCLNLLYVAWSLLFVSLISSVIAIWLSSQLYLFYPRYFNTKDKLEEKIKELDSKSGDYQRNIVTLFQQTINEAIQPVGKADSRTDIASKISLATLVAGLGAFLLFGGIQIG